MILEDYVQAGKTGEWIEVEIPDVGVYDTFIERSGPPVVEAHKSTPFTFYLTTTMNKEEVIDTFRQAILVASYDNPTYVNTDTGWYRYKVDALETVR